MDRIVGQLNLVCRSCPKAFQSRTRGSLERSVSGETPAYLKVSIREHFRDVREDLFLIALFHARLIIALMSNITCGTEHVEGASTEAQKEKNYQPPWRRACVAIKSPTNYRTNHDTSNKLAGEFHGLRDGTGCFRPLILGSWWFKHTLLASSTSRRFKR